MKEKFLSIFRMLDLDLQQIERLFFKLTSMYSFESRHYHSLEHINNLLQELDHSRDYLRTKMNRDQSGMDEAGIYRILYLASWFHDAIYEPTCNTNEVKSADLAATELQYIHYPEKETKVICELILSTINHKPIVDDGVCKFFLDMDLSILGQSPIIYTEYCQKIRREYSFVTEKDYRMRRSEKLKEFLSRDILYYTENFHDKYERQARSNLKMEITRLAESS